MSTVLFLTEDAYDEYHRALGESLGRLLQAALTDHESEAR